LDHIFGFPGKQQPSDQFTNYKTEVTQESQEPSAHNNLIDNPWENKKSKTTAWKLENMISSYVHNNMLKNYKTTTALCQQ
jgi:hypothetical protein